MILWLNLKSFFSNKLLSVVFCILLVVCLTGGLFGINYAYCNADYYNSYLTEQKLYTVYNSDTDLSDSVDRFLTQYSTSIDYAMGSFSMELDGQTYTVDAVIYLSELYAESMSVSYGESLSADDIDSGVCKIVLDSKSYDTSWIGKTITICGIEYKVTGLAYGQYLISFFSLTQTDVIEKIEFSLTEPIAKESDRRQFETDLSSIFTGLRISFPDSGDVKSVFDYTPMMLPTIILVILGFINLGFLYVFFIRMRRKQYTVFRLTGASTLYIFVLFIAEVLLLYTAAYALSIAIFKLVTATLFTYSASAVALATSGVVITDCMTFLRCLGVYAVLAVLLVILFMPSLIRTLKRDILC